MPLSLNLRPSIRPRRPLFCNPITELVSPIHACRSSLCFPASCSLLLACPVASESVCEKLVAVDADVAVEAESSESAFSWPCWCRPFVAAVLLPSEVLIRRPGFFPLRVRATIPTSALPSEVPCASLSRRCRYARVPSTGWPRPRPPPAAMADALNTAAAFLPSRTSCKRSTVASSKPLI